MLAVVSLKSKSRLRYSAKLGVSLRGWKPNDSWQRAATETLTDWKIGMLHRVCPSSGQSLVCVGFEKNLGYVWLKSLLPLRYESVQTAFVPKTHADVGLFLLLQVAEPS